LRPSIGQKKATIHAILIALYPVHWFFTFLYYTDVASVTAVLAMYLASVKRQYWFSALVCFPFDFHWYYKCSKFIVDCCIHILFLPLWWPNLFFVIAPRFYVFNILAQL